MPVFFLPEDMENIEIDSSHQSNPPSELNDLLISFIPSLTVLEQILETLIICPY